MELEAAGSSSMAPSSGAQSSQAPMNEAMMLTPSSSLPADLPPMPVPYEDFHFSLDLPTDLDMSDLQLLSGTDRKGGPSNPMTPGLTTAFLASTPHAFHGLEDTQMSSRVESRRGSFSKSRPQSPHVGSLGLGGISKPSDFAMRPPPPPDFEPPPGSNLFSPAASPLGLFGTGPNSLSKGKQAATPGPSNGSLFDASEKSLLSNFLEGFEWDFDPSLPEGMPSFAAAAAERASSAADAFGFGLGHRGSLGGGAQSNDHGGDPNAAGSASGSASGSGSATASSQSPHDSSSIATSPPNSKRGSKRSKQPNNNKTKPMAHESELVTAAFGGLPSWNDEQHDDSGEAAQAGSKRGPGHLPGRENSVEEARQQQAQLQQQSQQLADRQQQQQPPSELDLNKLTGVHAEMFHIAAGLDTTAMLVLQAASKAQRDTPGGKKVKVEHDDASLQQRPEGGEGGATSGSGKRELLTESEKRQNHILSEQRRRNYIREGFKELVVLLDDGRSLGARALGLSSGFGTGVEDEGLDDRTDVEDEDDILAVGRKKPPKKAKKAGPNGARARGKGRGRGGSAGGGAGSKSAVLFQAVDLIRWLDGKNEDLVNQCQELERLAGIPDPEALDAVAAAETTQA
ncbi:hypothetical protein ACQY0O_007675 [Thecaphora frezii]